MQNPLCCVSSSASAVAGDDLPNPSPPQTLTDLLNMPTPSPSFRSLSVPTDHNNNHHHHQFNASSFRSTSGSGCIMSRSLTSPADSGQTAVAVVGGEGITLNDVVGKGICGVLYKWVNYGRGWRPRWFVLQDAVLSFYKVRGPNKVAVGYEAGRGAKVIGEESFRRMSSSGRRGRSGISDSRRCSPAGEIHLKISTVRLSRSDDKRFSIFTGTKRIRLRAETREARAAWIDAIQAVKSMFPRVSNDELLKVQRSDLDVSTEKLRQRLLEEGVSEAVIQDSEVIMRNEFSSMYNQLLVLKQKEMLLLDALRQLETEKFDLENTIIDENRRLIKERGASSMHPQDRYNDYSVEESSSDPDDNTVMNEAAEEETEDEDNVFYDTMDILSSSSFKTSASEIRSLSFDSDEQGISDIEDDPDNRVRSLEVNHPCISRRKKLPDPVEKERGVSLWSLIKDNIGKDLSKVCLPVYFNEPLSSLQRCFEDLEYSYLIDQAYEMGKMGNTLMRLLHVAAFAVSGYASTEGRTCKPFNPLMGETYEADYPDKGLRFISEKVSHHPMILACHCEGRGWKMWGDTNLRNKFWGRSIQLDPVGVLTLEFDDGEVFRWSKVTTCIYNLILGKPYCDHYGTMSIQGNSDYSCKIKFKEQSIIGRNPHQVHGTIHDKSGKVVATLFGKWDESLHYLNGDCSGKAKASNPQSQAQLIWQRAKPPKHQTRYNLTSFAITLNEQTPGLKEKLPPTDSRLRPDQRHLENGEYELANSKKLWLEQRQRQARRMQQMGWKPRWFEKDKETGTYRYIGGYWEAREQGKWESCPDIFGDNPC